MICNGCGTHRLLFIFNLAPDVRIVLCASCLLRIDKRGNELIKVALDYMQAMDFAGKNEIGKPWSEKVVASWGLEALRES